ncbi:MAG TPA: TorF family putative porin [Allosphingosinicella sp.]|nr:TorF family putative porin [Allosphingosinicella sp.]
MPARAQLALSGTVASNDVFRGDSTSGDRPVATFTIAYDDFRGPYAGLSLTAVATGQGIEPLQSIQYAGYAHRLKSGVSLDIGVSHWDSSHYHSGPYGRDFTEAYVGIVGRRLSSHIFLSPDYEGRGGSVYAEVDGLLLDRGNWSLTGHAGALAAPSETIAPRRNFEADGRLAVTRRFGRNALSLAFAGATPSRDDDRWRRTILVSLTHNF